MKWLLIISGLAASLAAVGIIGYVNRIELIRWYFDLPEFLTEALDPYTVQVEMRDNVMLETRVYMPRGVGPWPTVLVRDAYSAYQFSCRLFSRYGYACVHQDVRGRYESQGEWYPVVNERNDGLDTLDWLVAESWQNGNIATFGSSYLGLVQWAMIDEMPSQVKTVIADVSHGDWFRIVYRGGHFVQGVMTEWAIQVHDSDSTLIEMARDRPVLEAIERHLGEQRAWYYDYVTNPDKTGMYWQADIHKQLRNAHKDAHMPILMTGAWHDFFIRGQLEVFEELPLRTESLFAIRNGSHIPADIKSFVHYFKLSISWMDHHLKGVNAPADIQPGYHLQSNIDGRYQHYENWPENTHDMTLYLTDLNSAHGCDGGHLSPDADTPAEHVSYVYDPLDPVSSLGGSYHFGTGIVDQESGNCSRSDVLSFSSEAFESSLTILGGIQITLDVASDAGETAFTVKLQEKLPDGKVLNIRDDISSVTFPQKSHAQGDDVMGHSSKLNFDLTPIKWSLNPGSTLRLDISSSNFPIYNAHGNNTGLWSANEDMVTAEQTLLGGVVSIPLMIDGTN